MSNRQDSPITVEEARERADAAYRGGKYEASEQLCRSVLQKTRDPDTLNLLGNVCIDTGRASHGVDFIKRATLVDPGRHEFRDSLEEAREVVDSLGGQEPVLYAFYDLQVSPVTYDFTTFLTIAGSHCVEKKCAEMVIVFVPGDNDGFRPEPPHMDMRYPTDGKHWRLRHILEASSWLSPYCRGTMLCRTRNEARTLYSRASGAHVFPETYHPDFPVNEYFVGHLIQRHKEGFSLPSLSPTAHARKRVEDWLQAHANGRNIVTLSLRETAYVPERNSNLQSWTGFAEWLEKRGYMPLFLRDEETAMGQALSQIASFPSFNEGVWNVDLRAAIYERALINMFVNNGPAALSYYNHRARTLIFKMLTPAWYATSEKFFRANSWEPGTDLVAIDNRRHKFIWKDDDLEVLIDAFTSACEPTS